MEPAMPSEDELIAQRRRKREQLLGLGDPYPARTVRTYSAGAAAAALVAAEAASDTAIEPGAGPAVAVAGRISALRTMGKAAFLDLRDESGRIQLHFRRDHLPDFEQLGLLDLGDFIAARGTVFRTRTGEATVAVDVWDVLTKAIRPLPEKWHGLTDTETRYRQRYLDLIANEESRELARKRSQVLASVRRFFHERGFLEVETPVLQEHAGGAAARPFLTHHNDLDRDLFLRISLELHLKQLLIGGFEKLFEIGRVFRNEGFSHRHNPEFTLLESYEAYADYHDVAAMVEALFRAVAVEVTGSAQLMHGEQLIDLDGAWTRTTYRQALLDHARIDYLDYPDVAPLRALARERGVHVDEGASWGTVLDALMSDLVEPKLVQPTFIFDYPAALSPLAKRRRDDDRLAERFELFILGYEMANAYSEQNDPVEQRARMAEQAAMAAAGDDEVELADEDFLTALEHGMPPAGGLGIGIERLIMLMTGQHSIREVILFPAMRERSSRRPAAEDAGGASTAEDAASDGGPAA